MKKKKTLITAEMLSFDLNDTADVIVDEMMDEAAAHLDKHGNLSMWSYHTDDERPVYLSHLIHASLDDESHELYLSGNMILAKAVMESLAEVHIHNGEEFLEELASLVRVHRQINKDNNHAQGVPEFAHIY